MKKNCLLMKIKWLMTVGIISIALFLPVFSIAASLDIGELMITKEVLDADSSYTGSSFDFNIYESDGTTLATGPVTVTVTYDAGSGNWIGQLIDAIILPYGEYRLIENFAPDGTINGIKYSASFDPVVIINDANQAVTVDVTNTVESGGGIVIMKNIKPAVDPSYEETFSFRLEVLDGGRYREVGVYQVLTTGGFGSLSINNLPSGEYRIEEINHTDNNVSVSLNGGEEISDDEIIIVLGSVGREEVTFNNYRDKGGLNGSGSRDGGNRYSPPVRTNETALNEPNIPTTTTSDPGRNPRPIDSGATSDESAVDRTTDGIRDIPLDNLPKTGQTGVPLYYYLLAVSLIGLCLGISPLGKKLKRKVLQRISN